MLLLIEIIFGLFVFCRRIGLKIYIGKFDKNSILKFETAPFSAKCDMSPVLIFVTQLVMNVIDKGGNRLDGTSSRPSGTSGRIVVFKYENCTCCNFHLFWRIFGSSILVWNNPYKRLNAKWSFSLLALVRVVKICWCKVQRAKFRTPVRRYTVSAGSTVGDGDLDSTVRLSVKVWRWRLAVVQFVLLVSMGCITFDPFPLWRNNPMWHKQCWCSRVKFLGLSHFALGDNLLIANVRLDWLMSSNFLF